MTLIYSAEMTKIKKINILSVSRLKELVEVTGKIDMIGKVDIINVADRGIDKIGEAGLTLGKEGIRIVRETGIKEDQDRDKN